MKRLCFIAASAGLFLVSNAPPPPGPDAGAYPPCSARVRDNCVQRRMREPESRALDSMPPGEDSGAPDPYYRPAPVASVEPRRVYPPCTASRQDSCTQVRSQVRYGHARPMHRVTPVRHARHARHVRRAGERG
jgi:hypothetical protein